MTKYVRKVWKGIVPGFKSTNPFYAFVFASIIGATIAWITVSANNSIDPLITSKMKEDNPDVDDNAIRAATWGANFLVALTSAFTIYLIMYGLFGYGEGMTVNNPALEYQVRRLLKHNKMEWSMDMCPLTHKRRYFI